MAGRLVISVSGKGGAGKTTLTALLIRWLLKHTEEVSLVVDADPATNLPEALGVRIERTVGSVSQELREKLDAGAISPTVSKVDLLEAWIFQTLVEADRFDLLAMGRSEGEGCYCFVNNVLTRILDRLTGNYAVTLLDMEAGLEHLSRRTERDVDVMLIVTDPSKMGLETARRIKELAEEVHIGVGRMYLVGNRFVEGLAGTLEEAAKERGLELAGLIPEDPNVAAFGVAGRSFLELPEDSPACVEVGRIARRIGLDRLA